MSKSPALAGCPICNARLALSGEPVKGELLECDGCGIELEVVGLGPVELRETPKAEAEWDDHGGGGDDD